MTESQLQFSIVTWLWNNFPKERGHLYMTENKTNKGAYYKGMGMIPGVSDMHYIAPCGTLVLFELKSLCSEHDIDHLNRQLSFIKNQEKRRALGFFVFEKEQFEIIMYNLMDGITDVALKMSEHSCNYVRQRIEFCEQNKIKRVKLDYNFYESL